MQSDVPYNEWMDLDTVVSVKTASDDFAPNVINDTVVGLKNVVRDPIGGPAPNLDERVETSAREQGTLDSYAKWEGIKKRFTHHKPNPEQNNAYDITRKAGMDMALTIFSLCPDTHERDMAIDAIDMAVMWANAAIARHWS